MSAVLTMPAPNPKQKAFMLDKHRYVAYGGARGGGKSFIALWMAIIYAMSFPGIRICIVRKTLDELRNNYIYKMQPILHGVAKYNKSEKIFTFPRGSTVKFEYCACESDLDHFQGAEYDVLFVDEACLLLEEWIDKIDACTRGVHFDPETGLPIDRKYPNRTYYMLNPGGPSHGYFKRLFIDRDYQEAEIPENYSFIQALVTDNKQLLEQNPDYINTLKKLPPKLRKAWLDGDWDVFEGQFFEDLCLTPDVGAAKEAGVYATVDELRQQHRWCHVIPPIDLSRGDASHWTICRSYDFGYGKPFSCAWWAVDYDGTLYRILELYGCTETPNEGLRWTPDQQFRKIAEIEREHPWLRGKKIDGVADPAIWDGSRGESVAETAARYGIYFVPGDNARIAGWMQVHYRLQFDENGYARMYIFDNCASFIRTMPLLVYDERAVEDLDTSMEDHCLSGDTQVMTESGWQSIESLVGTEGRVYSSDHKLHQYHDVRCTKRNADVYAVELEDGTIIYATDDHRFMTPAGEWVYVRDLLAGDEVKDYASTEDQRHDPEV